MFEPHFKTADSESGKTIELLEIERNLGRNLPKFTVYLKDKLNSCRQVFVNATDKESAQLQAKCLVASTLFLNIKEIIVLDCYQQVK